MIPYRKRENSYKFSDYKLPCKETKKMYFTVHYAVNKRRLKSSSAQTRSVQQMDFYWLFWINAIIFKKAYYKQVQYHKISLNVEMPFSACTAPAALEPVLIAGSALEGFEGVRKAVPEHGHLAPMAHWARQETKAPTREALLRMLDSLLKEWKKDKNVISSTTTRSKTMRTPGQIKIHFLLPILGTPAHGKPPWKSSTVIS